MEEGRLKESGVRGVEEGGGSWTRRAGAGGQRFLSAADCELPSALVFLSSGGAQAQFNRWTMPMCSRRTSRWGDTRWNLKKPAVVKAKEREEGNWQGTGHLWHCVKESETSRPEAVLLILLAKLFFLDFRPQKKGHRPGVV